MLTNYWMPKYGGTIWHQCGHGGREDTYRHKCDHLGCKMEYIGETGRTFGTDTTNILELPRCVAPGIAKVPVKGGH